jgi:hypothetical protein
VTLAVDHLVVAARTLDEGVQWCKTTLGITPGPGGAHAFMGTHNRLFRIACPAFANAYFEIIAIDAHAPAPAHPRWFGLDDIDLASGPRLIHWVARCDSIDEPLAALRRAGLDAGRPIEAARGDLRWRMVLRDDGRLLAHGAFPTLIDWGTSRHPAASMPASGVVLESLQVRGLAADVTLPRGVDRVDGPGPALTARLSTPRGAVTLTSTP